MNRADLAKGTLLMGVVVLIWGTFLPVSKIALAYIDPYYFTGLRYGIAAVAFALLLACIAVAQGHKLEAVEVLGAALVIGALTVNNLYNQRLAAAMGVRA